MEWGCFLISINIYTTCALPKILIYKVLEEIARCDNSPELIIVVIF